MSTEKPFRPESNEPKITEVDEETQREITEALKSLGLPQLEKEVDEVMTDKEEEAEIKRRVDHLFSDWHMRGYPEAHFRHNLVGSIAFYENYPECREGNMSELSYKACKAALEQLDRESGKKENSED